MLRSERGFYGHFSLAVNPNERHEPLGILSFIPVIRKEKKKRTKKKTARLVQADPEKEYLRWMQGIDAVEARLAGVKRVIHAADRESDSYEIIWNLARKNPADSGFVLRLRYDRNIVADDEVAKLYEVLGAAAGVADRTVRLEFRSDHKSAGTLKVPSSQGGSPCYAGVRRQTRKLQTSEGSSERQVPRRARSQCRTRLGTESTRGRTGHRVEARHERAHRHSGTDSASSRLLPLPLADRRIQQSPEDRLQG